MSKLVAADMEMRVRCPHTYNEWFYTSIWTHPCVITEDKTKESEVKRFDNFMDFFNFCSEDKLFNATAYYNWRKKPTVRINNASAMSTLFQMERNFKGIEIELRYIAKPEWSIDFLRKELPADDFIALCESKNWKIL